MKVFDASGEMVTSVSWVSSERGTSVHRMPGGGYSRVREDTHVVELLRSLGGYEIFVEALEVCRTNTILPLYHFLLLNLLSDALHFSYILICLSLL